MDALLSPIRFVHDMALAIAQADADGIWIMAAGSLVAMGCALLGCFLVLRRMSMMGDAISHAVLPGIVLAVLFTGSRSMIPILIGAGVLGVLTPLITDVLNRQGRLQSDAAMGVTFTWLFAFGIILISKFARQVDIDLDCVFMGEILYVPLDRLVVAGLDLGPREIWTVGPVALANAIFVVLAWKQLKVCAFDPGLAASMGIQVALWHYLLMGFVSMTTVAAFWSVGAILVVAFLTVPPNAAYMLTDRLWLMVVLANVFGIASAVIGYGVATVIDGSIAGAMATTAGALFALTVLLSPRHGVLAKWIAQRRAGAALVPEV
jgi:manganese/zinc/iron transport system permease protein